MLIYFYSFFPLLFLPTDSSSIRDRNFKNDLVPPMSSRLDPLGKDSNSLKVISDEPFIIQLDAPNPEENAKRNSDEKDMKSKKPTKKRVQKIKRLSKRQRRDLRAQSTGGDKERKSNLTEIPLSAKEAERQVENSTNSINKEDILKALSSYPKKREMKKEKKSAQNSREDKEIGGKAGKFDSSIQKHFPLDRAPLVKMAYPAAPKSDKLSHKYTYKDLMADRERLEKKIKYIRNMLNVSTADDLIRVRRRSESDRTANKIAKMFLTLSAVNGLHDKLKSKCDEDDEEGYRVQDVWEKEREDSPTRKRSSSNEDRYKVKKWIEHLKNRRSSKKTCPCMVERNDEESDAFPLEQKLPKNYHLVQRGESSEESLEALRGPHSWRDKPSRNNHYKRRNQKAREDHESKLKALAGRGNRKLELPLDDLELYRTKAKQILQNAEEILDKIKEEEEKRLSAPNILMSQLKELTSRIQADPRNKENDLIRKIQKNLGRGLTPKSQEGADGKSFLDNVKSFILDPYEKAKALTDESTKKLSSYLLRNLGELQESGEAKEESDDGKGEMKVFFGEVPKKEEERLSSANLARENPEHNLSKSEEDLQNGTVSSALGHKNLEDPSRFQEEQFQKRMQEMIKEQEKKLNEYEVPAESEDSSNELANSVGSEREKQKEEDVSPKEEKVASAKDETVADLDSNEKVAETSGIAQNNAPTDSDLVERKEDPEKERGDEETASKHLKEEEVQRDVLEEIMKEIQEEEENVESGVEPEKVESIFKEDGEQPKTSLEEITADDKLTERKPEQDVVAATAEETEAAAGTDDQPSESDFEVLSSPHLVVEESAQSPQIEEEEKMDREAEDPQGESEKEYLEMEPHLENHSPSDITEIPEPLETTEEQLKSQNDVEAADLLQETKAQESPKVSDEEGEAEESNKGENLQLGNAGMEYSQDGESGTEEESKVSEEDRLSKSAVSGEDKVMSSADLIGDTAEGSDDTEREVLGEAPGFSSTDEAPLMSVNVEGEKREPLEESGEVSVGQPLENGEEESLQRAENPAEEALDTEDGAILKETERENEESQNVSKESQSGEEKVGEPKEDDESKEVAAVSGEVGSERVENADSSNEALLESVKSQEESDKDIVEASVQEMDPSPSETDEDGETLRMDEVSDESLKLEKPSSEDEREMENLKETHSSEVVSEKRNEENMEEEETLAKEEDPMTEMSQETDISNAENVGEGNIMEEAEAEENKDTMLKSSSGGDPDSNDQAEEDPLRKSSETSKEDESVKAALENQDEGQFEENEGDETNLQAAKMSEEKSNYDEAEKTENSKPSSDVQYDENEDKVEETHLKAANDAESTQSNLITDEDEALKSALADENRETLEETGGEEPVGAVNNANENNDENISSKATENKEDEPDETPLRAANIEGENEEEAEEVESTNEGSVGDDETLRATITKDDEEYAEVEESPLREANMRDDDKEAMSSSRENEEEASEYDESSVRAENPENAHQETGASENDINDETSVRAENPENAYQEAGASENDISDESPVRAENPENLLQETRASENDVGDETPLRAASLEDLNNNIGDEEETPLRSAMDSNYAESPTDVTEDNSDESLRASNPYDFNNQIDEENEDETTPLKSANPLDDPKKESESSYETVREENPSVYSEETEAAALSKEEVSSPVVADTAHQTQHQHNPEEVSLDNLQKLDPQTKSLKAGKLKVPTSIAKIMKDLGGKGKDISTIENLNPEKIDDIIDKIGEAEEQNKVIDEVDCRKECACAEDIDTRSRNIGRYEIVKDFLQWMKDLQLNRVLSDD